MDERTVEIDSKALGTDLASKIATEAFKHVPKYSWGGDTASHIHGVIQLAALNALTASGLTSKLAALEDENKTLRDAVEQYADPRNWVVNGRFDPHSGNFDGTSFADTALSKPAASIKDNNHD